MDTLKTFLAYQRRHYGARAWWRTALSLVAMLAAGWLAYRQLHATTGVLLAVNTFEMVDWLMQDSLDILVNKLAAGALFNTEVQKEFEHDFAVGETVRVKFPQSYLIREGLAYSEQPINRRHTTVTCNQIFGIDFGYDSFEKAVKMERGEEVLRREYVEPAMAELAQEIENRCVKFAYQNASALVGILGTDPTDYDTSSAAARQKLVELGCPAGKERGYLTTPSVMRSLKKSSVSYFNPTIDIAKAFRTGIAGSGDGFDFYESVSLYSHTAGHWAGTVQVSGAGQTGSSLVITATAGDTFKAGDKFSIINVNPTNPRTRRRVGASAKTWSIAQDLTAAGGTGADTLVLTESIYGPGSQYQNVDALPADTAAMTLWPGTANPNDKAGTISLALHPDAFALVAVPFDNPTNGGGITARQLTDDETGIKIALVRAFDPIGRRWITRFDTCVGFGNLYNGNCAVAIAGA